MGNKNSCPTCHCPEYECKRSYAIWEPTDEDLKLSNQYDLNTANNCYSWDVNNREEGTRVESLQECRQFCLDKPSCDRIFYSGTDLTNAIGYQTIRTGSYITASGPINYVNENIDESKLNIKLPTGVQWTDTRC